MTYSLTCYGNAYSYYSADGMAFSALGNVSDDVVISDEKLSLSADVEYHGEARVFEGDFNERNFQI